MQYIFGKSQKTEKKVDNQVLDVFKQKLKQQFCELCQKKPGIKVAFGKQYKPVFTCANCELKAVGGSVQKLGPQTLISTQKFAQILTKQLISYQNNVTNPPPEHKREIQTCLNVKNKIGDLSTKISDQYKKMKKNIRQKHDSLYEESLQENTIPIFQEVNKLMKEKKMNSLQDGRMILKRSLCNQKGLHFSDDVAMEAANTQINQKFKSLKKQSKIKLKPLEELIDEINNIQL